MELEKLTGLQIGELVKAKGISPTEVVGYFADRIGSKNASINAFTYVMIDEAYKEAALLEKRITRGEECGDFAGVPICLKDFLSSKKGWKHSYGGVQSLVCEDEEDSAFYAAAHEMDAIAIGKTNCPPFGFKGTCDNKMFGPTKNPFNTEYNSGGSSGGTAAAVAAGLVPLGEGGDAGGSIRIPASWCNCYGFKSSLGTVPSVCRPDAWAATHPFCFNGAITKDVADSAAILNHMARYNARDPYSLPINSDKDFLEAMKQPIAGMKIALTVDFNLFPIDPRIAALICKCAKKLEDAGAVVEIVSFKFKHTLDDFARAWCWSISLDTHLQLEELKSQGLDMVKDHRDELTEEFIYWNDIAGKVGIHDFRMFNEIRTDILDQHENVFEKYDAIISPATCCKPLTNEDQVWGSSKKVICGKELSSDTDFISFCQTFLINFIGYPAASIPAGFIDDLPIGMQIISKKFRDDIVLAISRTFEEIQPWDYSKIVV